VITRFIVSNRYNRACMPFLNVEIVAFVDDFQPGFVECAFTDFEGKRHTFIEKLPVVTAQNLTMDSMYPLSGAVPCESVEPVQDASGRRLARISIAVSDSIDSPCRSAQYVVLESEVSDGY
jgi:hypothetical protein